MSRTTPHDAALTSYAVSRSFRHHGPELHISSDGHATSADWLIIPWSADAESEVRAHLTSLGREDASSARILLDGDALAQMPQQLKNDSRGVFCVHTEEGQYRITAGLWTRDADPADGRNDLIFLNFLPVDRGRRHESQLSENEIGPQNTLRVDRIEYCRVGHRATFWVEDDTDFNRTGYRKLVTGEVKYIFAEADDSHVGKEKREARLARRYDAERAPRIFFVTHRPDIDDWLVSADTVDDVVGTGPDMRTAIARLIGKLAQDGPEGAADPQTSASTS